MKYALAVALTLFAVYLGAMLWFHFPNFGVIGLLLLLPPIICLGLIVLYEL